jgi:hypothetical protein
MGLLLVLGDTTSALITETYIGNIGVNPYSIETIKSMRIPIRQINIVRGLIARGDTTPIV